jgi:hypothetical protein
MYKNLYKFKKAMSLGLIVAVIIFVLGLILFITFITGRFFWPGVIDEEACHDSIVLRSSISMGPIQASKYIPLKCQTKKICITQTGQNCEDSFAKSSLDNPVLLRNVPKDINKAKLKILEEFAKAMYTCHSVVGEGKLKFMPNDYSKENYCLICSRIALEPELREVIKTISYDEMYSYLENKKTINGVSYLSYVHPDWKDHNNLRNIFESLKENSKDPNFKNLEYEDWKFEVSGVKGNAIVVQMAPLGTLSSLEKGEYVGAIAAGAVIVTGAILLASGIGSPLGVGLIAAGVGAASGTFTFFYTHPDGESVYIAPTIVNYNVDDLKSLNCYDFKSAP